MKRWLIVLFSLGLLAPAAAFWQSRDSNYNHSISAGASYQGPGNIVSGWTAFWSCGRAYTASYASGGGNLCIIYGNTTTTTCTLTAGSNGFANLTALLCVGGTVNIVTFCTVTNTSCNIQQMYDQTGNGNNALNPTVADQPAISFSVSNGLPCAFANTTGTVINLITSSLSFSLPFAYEAVTERTANTTTVQRIMSSGGSGSYIQFRGATNSVAMSAGTQIQSSSGTPDNSFLALVADFDLNANADSVLVANGSVVAGPAATGSTSPTGTFAVDGDNGIAAPVSGYVCEAGIYPAFMTSTQYGNVITNARSSANGWNF